MSADVVAHPLDLTHGTLKLPDAPGLGVTVDVDALARYRRSERHRRGRLENPT